MGLQSAKCFCTVRRKLTNKKEIYMNPSSDPDSDGEIVSADLLQNRPVIKLQNGCSLQKLPQQVKKFGAFAMAFLVALPYVCMNRQGSTEIPYNSIRWLTAVDSGFINVGLYYLVWRNFFSGPLNNGQNTSWQKYQRLFNTYLSCSGLRPGSLTFISTLSAVGIYSLCLIAAIPMLEATVAGSMLLNFPSRMGTVLGWYMTASRGLAVFQGLIGLPDTWKYLKNAYRYQWTQKNDMGTETHGPENSTAVKVTIGTLTAISVMGSAAYVLTMRSSVLTALGTPTVFNQKLACQFQKTHLSVHLAIQWLSTGINFPFYVLWISRGLIRGLEPIWNPTQRNDGGLRFWAFILAFFSLAPSAAPLFSSAKDTVLPIIKDGCQITGHWVAPDTILPFEQDQKYQLGAGTGINMLFALFMNVSSLLENFGVYNGQKETMPESTSASRKPKSPGSDDGTVDTDSGQGKIKLVETPREANGRLEIVASTPIRLCNTQPNYGTSGTNNDLTAALLGEDATSDLEKGLAVSTR